MKAYIRAWKDVINPVTGQVHNEARLRTLDAILYGPVREVKELTDDVAEEMVEEFKKLYPDFRYDHLEVHAGQ